MTSPGPGVGDGGPGETPGGRQENAGTPLDSFPYGGWRPRPPRYLLLIVGVVLLVALPSWYLLTQDESRSTSYALSVTTSCPRGVWSPPAPGELTGACSYLGSLDVPTMSRLSGTYVSSNSSPIWVVVDFHDGSYNSTESNGSFALDGTAPFTWQSIPWPFGPGDAASFAAITVVSNYPITVTFQGTYSSPLIA
jgi:hypothetical protein